MSLSGLELWLDASQLEGYDDTDDVNPWTNLANPANSPAVGETWRANYTANAINGLPALNFNPATPDFYVGFSVTLPTFSIFVVQQTTGNMYFLGKEDDNVQVRIGEGGSNILSLFTAAGGSRTSGVLTTDRSEWSLVEYFYDGTTVSFRENGQALSGSGAFAELVISEVSGAFQGAAGVNGMIAEIVVYNRALSPSQRAQIEAYLMEKYNL